MKMTKEKGDIEAAAYVYWSSSLEIVLDNVQDPHLHNEATPETILIEKDSLRFPSMECRMLAKTILNMPEEMFLSSGKFKKTKLRELVKQKTGWPLHKIRRIENMLADQLVDATA